MNMLDEVIKIEDLDQVGTDGDDDLYGTDSDDKLAGGLGDDYLYGLEGRDTYVYGKGDGNDTIIDWSNSDNYLLLKDINPDEISVISSSSDLIITILSTNETITLQGQNSEQLISRVTFADGTVWNAEELFSHAKVIGTIDDDILIGSIKDDKIFAGEGDDILFGHLGDDTYYYSQGDGNDLLFDWFGNNTLVLTDLNPNDITISNVNSDSALITILATGDTITVEEHFFRDSLQAIRFADGTEWNRADIVNNLTNSLSQAANFHYASTDGDITLSDLDGIKHLFFNDLNPNDIEVANVNNGDAVFTVIPTGAKITVSGQFIDAGFGYGVLSSIDFADGTRWLPDEITDNALTLGTDADDHVIGSDSSDDRIIGGNGDDLLEGGWGDDTYYYNLGDGNDTIIDSDGWNDLVLTGIAPDDVSFSINTNSDLTITIESTGETIIWKELLKESPSNYLNSIRFDDGTQWYKQDILAQAKHIGTDQSETIIGTFDSDVIVGNGGDDILEGGFGRDSYIYREGDGNDVIIADNNSNDRLIFDDLTPRDINVSKTDYDIVITVESTNETITIKDYLAGYVSQMIVEFSDGTIWDGQDLEQSPFFLGGSSFFRRSEDSTVISGTAGDDIMYLQGGWHTVYQSHGGNDTFVMTPEAVIDPFVFSNGSNLNTVIKADNLIANFDLDKDVLDFRLIEDVTSYSDLLIESYTSSFAPDDFNTRVFIVTSDEHTGETIKTGQIFLAGVDSRLLNESHFLVDDSLLRSEFLGTNSEDMLSGTSDADRIEGKKGNDVLTGNDDNDTFIFADNFGNDTITDFNNDTIEFGDNTFDSYTEVLSAMVEDGADTLITLDANNSIRLENVSITDLQEDDFRFV